MAQATIVSTVVRTASCRNRVRQSHRLKAARFLLRPAAGGVGRLPSLSAPTPASLARLPAGRIAPISEQKPSEKNREVNLTDCDLSSTRVFFPIFFTFGKESALFNLSLVAPSPRPPSGARNGNAHSIRRQQRPQKSCAPEICPPIRDLPQKVHKQKYPPPTC